MRNAFGVAVKMLLVCSHLKLESLGLSPGSPFNSSFLTSEYFGRSVMLSEVVGPCHPGRRLECRPQLPVSIGACLGCYRYLKRSSGWQSSVLSLSISLFSKLKQKTGGKRKIKFWRLANFWAEKVDCWLSTFSETIRYIWLSLPWKHWMSLFVTLIYYQTMPGLAHQFISSMKVVLPRASLDFAHRILKLGNCQR